MQFFWRKSISTEVIESKDCETDGCLEFSNKEVGERG